MPRRTEIIRTNQTYFVRPEAGAPGYRVFSPEQLEELINSGKITETSVVQISTSVGGYGGTRGSVAKEGAVKVMRGNYEV